MMFLAAGVWGLGAGSAAALTIDLAQPPTPRLTTLEDVAVLHTDVPTPVRHLGLDSRVLTLPPITIAAPRVRPRVVAPATTPEPLPDIARMTCAPPRDLQMGSGRVQVCE